MYDFAWCRQKFHPRSVLLCTRVKASSPQLSVAVCIGFLTAWSPYAAVAMWAALGDATQVPPDAFALAAVFAKSSTIYNPLVYLLCKPNFRECLYRDTSMLRQRLHRGSPHLEPREHLGAASQRSKDVSVSTRLSNGQPDGYGACLQCNDSPELCHVTGRQRTACVLTASGCREVTVSQLPAQAQAGSV